MQSFVTYLKRHHVAYLALFIALGGTSYAAVKLPANSVSSKQIKRNAVTGAKVKDGSLTVKDLKKGTIPAAVSGLQGPKGDSGAKGDQGAKGDPGAKGDTGPAGSPDSPADVLAKLTQVDGTGSGVDADSLDGKTADDFARRSAPLDVDVVTPGTVVLDTAGTDAVVAAFSKTVGDECGGGITRHRYLMEASADYQMIGGATTDHQIPRTWMTLDSTAQSFNIGFGRTTLIGGNGEDTKNVATRAVFAGVTPGAHTFRVMADVFSPSLNTDVEAATVTLTDLGFSCVG